MQKGIYAATTIICALLAAPGAHAASLPAPPEAIVLREGCNAVQITPGASPQLTTFLRQTGGACTVGDIVRIPLAWPASNLHFARWHEYGHVFDHEHLRDPMRARLHRFLGGRSKWAGELFADTYANCAFGHRFDRFESNYGFAPESRRGYRKACNLLQRIARRQGLSTTS